MKVARTVLNGESGSNAADLHNTILGNVVPMRARTDSSGNTSPKERRQCPKYCVNEKTGFRYHLLYLDSVFKYKNKLVHNQAPIMNRLCPFLLNFHQR